MILKGVKFDDLSLPSRFLSDGSYLEACDNCKETFRAIF